MKKSLTTKQLFTTVALIAASAIPGIATPLLSQQTPPLDPTVAHALDSLPTGTPVRVYVQNPSSYRVDGRLLRYDRGHLLINPTDSLARTINWNINDVRSVDALGRRSDGWAFGHGAGVGALVGLSIGVIATAVVSSTSSGSCSDCFISPAAVATILTVPFTVVTTVVGGFVGLGFRDKWRTVPIPIAPTQPPK